MLVLLAVGMVVGVSLAMAVGWLCRNLRPYGATQVPGTLRHGCLSPWGVATPGLREVAQVLHPGRASGSWGQRGAQGSRQVDTATSQWDP